MNSNFYHRFRFLPLLGILILGVPVRAAEHPFCTVETLQALFKIVPKVGDPVEAHEVGKLIPHSVEENEITRLGQGNSGEVFRIKPKSVPEQSFIAKAMAADDALHDYVGFSVVREAVESQNFVKIVRAEVEKIDDLAPRTLKVPAVMHLQDVKGRSLFSLLVDPNVPAAVKDDLRMRYHQFIKQVAKHTENKYQITPQFEEPAAHAFPGELRNVKSLLEKHRLAEAQPQLLRLSMSAAEICRQNPVLLETLHRVSGNRVNDWFRSGKTIELLLKSDNIFVTEKYEMYLIDPY